MSVLARRRAKILIRIGGRVRCDAIWFVVFGVGSGAVFVILNPSYFVAYRSSGIVNLATVATTLIGAYSFVVIRRQGGFWIQQFRTLGGPNC